MTGFPTTDPISVSVPVPATSTRERILFEAASLFARRGFHATTTRQIADAVGIRQPSLFHHFPSKNAIVEALLDWDLGRALPHVEAIAGTRQPAAVRMFRYLRDDVRHLAGAPYNLSGIYTEEVMGQPEFASWARRRDSLHDTVEALVREGIANREFIEVDAALVRQAIAGILVRALTVHSGGRGPQDRLPDEVARIIVRGLLLDPTTIDGVQLNAELLRIEGDTDT